jgi:hypothetical protein
VSADTTDWVFQGVEKRVHAKKRREQVGHSLRLPTVPASHSELSCSKSRDTLAEEIVVDNPNLPASDKRIGSSTQRLAS